MTVIYIQTKRNLMRNGIIFIYIMVFNDISAIRWYYGFKIKTKRVIITVIVKSTANFLNKRFQTKQ